MRPGQEHHLAGIRATADGGECPACHEPILKEQRIVRARRGWTHTHCAPGFDDGFLTARTALAVSALLTIAAILTGLAMNLPPPI